MTRKTSGKAKPGTVRDVTAAASVTYRPGASGARHLTKTVTTDNPMDAIRALQEELDARGDVAHYTIMGVSD